MNPFTSMISLVILFTVYHILLTILVWRICIDSDNNPLIDIFLNSHYLFTWDCIDIFKRSSVLVITGSERVNHFGEWKGSLLEKLLILPHLTGKVALKCLTF